LPMSKVHTTLEKYGNTSAASVAVTLDEAAREGRIATGDLVVLVGFGGGVAWGAVAVRWTNPASGRL
ncbi:MAG: 3-oxoacyl-[acyl-carrier-protein] synthase III C-terminal domain-containing protein, partial [Kiritimatiellia bacterium]|nr:3-oxoacyl-[acyl-carrier-protein] synthase III C-terminal domain-containing protein [Kiritimatiellia bacterium]